MNDDLHFTGEIYCYVKDRQVFMARYTNRVHRQKLITKQQKKHPVIHIGIIPDTCDEDEIKSRLEQ